MTHHFGPFTFSGTPERCIRFFDDDFNLNVVPTMTTTTHTTATSFTTPLPPVQTCELPANTPADVSLAESVYVTFQRVPHHSC